jgi:hypothetical protein
MMNNSKKEVLRIILLLFVGLFLFAERAHSYIDLGSGSYFFQILIAAIMGALFTVKIYWKKMKTFLTNLFSKEKDK